MAMQKIKGNLSSLQKKTLIEGIKSQQTKKDMPKETLQQLTQDAGGVLRADSSGSIPQSRQQM